MTSNDTVRRGDRSRHREAANKDPRPKSQEPEGRPEGGRDGSGLAAPCDGEASDGIWRGFGTLHRRE